MKLIFSNGRIMNFPFPFRLLRLLLLLTYFIYLPIALFKSDLFIVLLDLVLILGVAITVTSKNWKTSLSQHSVIYVFLVFYVISAIAAFFLQSDITDFSALKTLRNLIFGAGVFVISSTYVTDKAKLGALLKTFLWGSLLAALYGYRQLFFGFFNFELDRLALMGSSLQEMETLGRSRITATFGDPLLCGFFMMAGVFVYFASRHMNLVPFVTRTLHPLGPILILGVLVGSLTRAPLLGLACGMALVFFADFRPTRKWLLGRTLFLLLVFLGIWVITLTVENGWLADSDSDLIKALNSAFSSVWSLTQLFASTETSSNWFLVEQSRDQRIVAWGKGLDYLTSHPLGIGLSDPTIFDFSLGDVGILKILLLVGVLGGLAMLSTLSLVLAKGVDNIVNSLAPEGKEIGVLFLGLWVAILATNGISCLLDGSVASILIWTIAGIIINLKQIFLLSPHQRTE